VLRLVLTLEGETVAEALGVHRLPAYRHREVHGVPHLTQGTTFITRADYHDAAVQRARVLPVVERLLGIEDKIPERATLIRVLMLELNRISSHLGGSGVRP